MRLEDFTRIEIAGNSISKIERRLVGCQAGSNVDLESWLGEIRDRVRLEGTSH
jgi:Tfp pilus assembly protein PilP